MQSYGRDERPVKAFEQAHKHDRELAQAVDEAIISEVSLVYSIAILGLLLLIITGLWLEVL